MTIIKIAFDIASCYVGHDYQEIRVSYRGFNSSAMRILLIYHNPPLPFSVIISIFSQQTKLTHTHTMKITEIKRVYLKHKNHQIISL